MNKQREQSLIEIIDDLLWMAARYADGRHTYAPSIIRDTVKHMKLMYPSWEVKEDITLHPPKPENIGGFMMKEDYLWDIFNPLNKK